MTSSGVISSSCGAIVPLTLKRLGADPDTASSIFLTAATDMVSMGMLLGWRPYCWVSCREAGVPRHCPCQDIPPCFSASPNNSWKRCCHPWEGKGMGRSCTRWYPAANSGP